MKTAYLVGAVLAVGCTDHLPEYKSIELQVTITSPTDVGDVNTRLDGSNRGVTVNLAAFDENGKPATDYNNTLGVYTHYLGTLTPYLTDSPLATVQMTNGVAMNQSFTLPAVFGPTTVWFDDDSGANTQFVAGTSDTLWYRDPWVSDTQRPISETALGAASSSQLDGKNVSVDSSEWGSNGRMVVTSVYAQGLTIADVKCSDAAGDPPCVGSDYGYMDIFSYSAPLDSQNRYIVEGQLIDGFAGGVSAFDGLIEIGFPQVFVNAATVDVNIAREPPPIPIDMTWFTTNKMNFKHAQSAALEVDNAVVCALDSDYTTYKQWKIDPSGMGDPTTCGGNNVINIVTAGTLDLDPGTLVGKTLPKVVGILRPIVIGSYAIWIIYPRTMADITTD